MSAIYEIALKMQSGVGYHNLELRDGVPYLTSEDMPLSEARARYPSPISRQLARILHYDVFESHCGKHGPNAPHHTQHGYCTACHQRDSTPRADARREGATTYLADCPLHAVTPHSTMRGLCLTCYTTLGTPRTAETNPTGVYLDPQGEVREAPEAGSRGRPKGPGKGWVQGPDGGWFTSPVKGAPFLIVSKKLGEDRWVLARFARTPAEAKAHLRRVRERRDYYVGEPVILILPDHGFDQSSLA